MHRRDIYNFATVNSGAHPVVDELTAAQEWAIEIRLEHAIEISQRHVCDPRIAATDACVIDKDVRRTKPPRRHVKERSHASLLRNVELLDDGLAAGGSDAPVGLLGSGLVGMECDRDQRSCAGEFSDDGLADARIGPCDNRHLAFQLFHGPFSRFLYRGNGPEMTSFLNLHELILLH